MIVIEHEQELCDEPATTDHPRTAPGVRTLALPSHLLADFEDHLLRWVGRRASDPLFTGPLASEPYRETFNSAWDGARRAVGMDDFHFHDLRDAGNTLAASRGASTKELMARIGHASARAALILLHASEERDVLITEHLSAMTEAALTRVDDATKRAPLSIFVL